MNNSEQEMATWLAHPMEFGTPPMEIKEIYREKTSWPLFDDEIELVFHQYKMKNGFTSIGMTGPITWSFLGDNLNGFSMEELKRLYAGWYIAFSAINSENYSEKQNQKQWVEVEAKLKREHTNFINVLDYLSVGELIFYAYKVMQNDAPIVIVTDIENQMEYEANSKYLRLPPLYYFLGSLFFEGKL
jgi:hypothetical protein